MNCVATALLIMMKCVSVSDLVDKERASSLCLMISLLWGSICFLCIPWI